MPPASPAAVSTAVLLCAGGSRRMGTPKPLLPWGESTLLQAHLRALQGCTVFVVTGAHREALALPASCIEVFNARWEETTMGESAQLAARRLDGPALFIPIDTVPDASVLARLRSRRVTTVPVDLTGRRGHPLLLARSDVRALARAQDPSLRPFSLSAEPMPTRSRLCAEDFDTPQALARIREGVARGGLEPPTPRV